MPPIRIGIRQCGDPPSAAHMLTLAELFHPGTCHAARTCAFTHTRPHTHRQSSPGCECRFPAVSDCQLVSRHWQRDQLPGVGPVREHLASVTGPSAKMLLPPNIFVGRPHPHGASDRQMSRALLRPNPILGANGCEPHQCRYGSATLHAEVFTTAARHFSVFFCLITKISF